MGWRIEFKASVEKDFRHLDAASRRRVLDFLEDKVTVAPRKIGKPLKGSPFWRYRISDYRVVCEIIDEDQVVRVLRVAHRREAYR